MAEHLEYVISLKGGPQAVAEAKAVQRAVGQVGGQMKAVDRESRRSARGTQVFGGSLKHLAGQLAAVGIGYKAWSAAKGAFEFTKELEIGTKKLTTTTGLSVEQSSRWVTVANAMGVPASALGMTFSRAAAAVEKQVASTGKSQTALDKLGISTKFVNAHAHDFNGIMQEVVKRFAEMKGGPEKTALELAIFGRGWQTLNPLLGEGAKGLNEYLDMAKKFGVELHGNTAQQLDELRHREIESKIAGDSLRLSFVQLAAKPMSDLLRTFSKLALALKTGDWKQFDREANRIAGTLSKLAEHVLPKLAETFVKMAPILLAALWRGFTHASLLGGGAAAALLIVKLGLGGGVARAAFGAAGLEAGTAFAIAFAAAAAIYIGLKLGDLLKKWLHLEGTDTYERGPHGELRHLSKQQTEARQGAEARRAHNLYRKLSPAARRRDQAYERAHPGAIPHGALGGVALSGGSMLVGERGPEIVSMPKGSQVAPLAPGSLSGGDIILKMDGREMWRWVRWRQTQAMAANADT